VLGIYGRRAQNGVSENSHAYSDIGERLWACKATATVPGMLEV